MGSRAADLEIAPARPARWLLAYVAVLAALTFGGVVLYVVADPERRVLDQSVRDSVAGQFVHLSDGYTHYELGGPTDGRVVVLAAGASVPYYIWDPTFAALTSAGFRVLRYDYYGRGYSDRPEVRYTQDLYVRQLIELLDALHIGVRIDLGGLSFGGSVITSVADRYPARIHSLIYVDPAFRTPQPVSPLASLPGAWNIVTAIFEERGWAAEQSNDFLHPERFPDWPDRYRPQLQYRGFRRARLSDLVQNAKVDQRPELVRVGGDLRPVLVVWGRQDSNVPFEFSASLMQAMPRARLVPVDEAGHLPQWEQPSIVHEALVSFLRQIP